MRYKFKIGELVKTKEAAGEIGRYAFVLSREHGGFGDNSYCIMVQGLEIPQYYPEKWLEKAE
jgi:hypothetical protein